MGFTHGVRNLVLGSAVTAGVVVVGQGVASAEEAQPPATPPPERVPPESPAPVRTVAAAEERGAAPPSDRVPQRPPRTEADEVEQPPPPPASATAAAGPDGPAKKAAVTAAITTPGPLTRVETSADLNCSVSHAADRTPAFFEDTACGTLLSVGGELFGPARIPPTSREPTPRTAYTKLRQSPVTGSGSLLDPHKLVTEVGLGSTGLSISQTDTYVTGQEGYRTDVTVRNAGPVARTGQLYRAGDCVVGDLDEGFGSFDPATGAVACVGARDVAGNAEPTARTQQWYPISSGSHHYEGGYIEVWSRIGAQLPFPDLCQLCTVSEDNGAGLSWEITVPAGGSVTRSHLTVFSLLGVRPLTVTTTPRTATALAGSVVTYTVVVSNPNPVTVNLAAIVDSLPAGFTYVPGSSSRITTADPTVMGQVLTWRGPIEMSPSSLVALDFNVRVPTSAGDYLNQAGADAGAYVVLPAGDSSGLTVVGVPDVPPAPVPLAVGGTALVRASQTAPFSPRRHQAPSLTASSTAGQLPVTGSDLEGLLALGVVLLAGGGGLVTVGRRARPI